MITLSISNEEICLEEDAILTMFQEQNLHPFITGNGLTIDQLKQRATAKMMVAGLLLAAETGKIPGLKEWLGGCPIDFDPILWLVQHPTEMIVANLADTSWDTEYEKDEHGRLHIRTIKRKSEHSSRGPDSGLRYIGSGEDVCGETVDSDSSPTVLSDIPADVQEASVPEIHS